MKYSSSSESDHRQRRERPPVKYPPRPNYQRAPQQGGFVGAHNAPIDDDDNAMSRGNKLRKRLSIKLDGNSAESTDAPVAAVKSFHARTSDEHHARGVNGPLGGKGAHGAAEIPPKIFASLQEKFGPPSCQCTSFAYWDAQTLQARGFQFVAVEVRAEGVEHKKPVLHSDHVYIYMKCDIPAERITDVLQLSDTITYDRGAKVLGVRCAGWKSNIATLLLATKIAAGKLSLKLAQEKRLLEKLTKRAAEDTQKAQEYEGALRCPL